VWGLMEASRLVIAEPLSYAIASDDLVLSVALS